MTAPTTGFREDVQRLRGLAVLLVVVFHMGFLPGGFIGVDVFFVISGYVVTASVLREIRRTSTFDVRRFLVRRARRLLPALALMSTSVLTLSILLLGFTLQPLAAATAAGAHLLVANAVLYVGGGGYFSPADERNPFLHTWSLSVEEQFFLLLALGLVVATSSRSPLGRREGRRRRLTAIAWLLTVASFLLSLAMSTQTLGPNELIGLPERFAFYSPLTRLWEFMAGVLLAVHRPGRPPARLVSGLTSLAFALLLMASVLLEAEVPLPGLAAVVPVAATSLAIWAGGSTSPAERSRSASVTAAGRLLQWLGDNSYSWYLWHWPLLVLAREVWDRDPWIDSAAVLVALLIAQASRVRVEDPIRFRRSSKVGAVLVASSVPPLVVGALVFTGGSAAWGLPHPASTARGISYDRECHDTPQAVWPAERCHFPGGGEGLVLLLGDSHAASLTEGVIAAAGARGLDTAVWAQSGCPFTPGRPIHEGRSQPRPVAECRAWQDGAAALIDELRPDVVVLGQRSSGLANLMDPAGRLNERFVPGRTVRAPTSEPEAAADYRTAMTGAVEWIRATGASVIIVHNVPEFTRGQFDPFDRSMVRTPEPPTADRSVAVGRSATARGVEVAIAADRDGVALVDPYEFLCDEALCRSADGNEWWYFDRHHLSPIGSARLAPGFESALAHVLDGPARGR